MQYSRMDGGWDGPLRRPRHRAKSQATEPKIIWPAPPASWPLGPCDAHVWAATLSLGPEHISAHAKVLSLDELQRAGRFHFDQDRRRFIAARGLLRTILGRYLGLEPSRLEFDYSSRGKPALAGCFKSEQIHFNLAHSENLMLLAVSHARAIGVDVERLRPVREAETIAERFFSARESEGLKALPRAEKQGAFFNLWTRKEALLKALGEGIADSLNQAEVSYSADEPVRLLRLFGNPTAGFDWRLCGLVPAAGFVAALAVAMPDVGLCCWRWVESVQPPNQ